MSDRATLHARTGALRSLIEQAQSSSAPTRRRPDRADDTPQPLPQARRLPPLRLQRLSERFNKPRSELRSLIDTARELARINQAFAIAARPPLALHASIVRLDPQGWTVLVDSPAWASRLRFGAHAVQRKLQAHLRRPVPDFDIRVQALAAPRPQPSHRPLHVSEQSAQWLSRAAGSFGEQPLGRALARLADHACRRATTVGEPVDRR